MELYVKNFSCDSMCSDERVGIVFSGCNTITCKFYEGINILYGSIDDGGWALSSAMSNSKGGILDPESEFILNTRRVSLGEIHMLSYNLGYYSKMFKPLRTKNFTVEKALKKNLRRSSVSQKLEDICSMYEIDEDTRNKKISCTRALQFRCQAAIGQAADKKIFCLPWLSNREMNFYFGEVIRLGKLLANCDAMLLVPTESKQFIKESSGNIIDFTLHSKNYLYNIESEK